MAIRVLKFAELPVHYLVCFKPVRINKKKSAKNSTPIPVILVQMISIRNLGSPKDDWIKGCYLTM